MSLPIHFQLLEEDAIECQGLALEAGAAELVRWVGERLLPTIHVEEDFDLAETMLNEAWNWLEAERIWRA